ncbi:MAG: hypothetical protein KF798_02145 [Candidatus Paracaedibacteraceae bacterium]|nr:hypothetical protein [Candidatus Paracaedibacteraceae bacterium]
MKFKAILISFLFLVSLVYMGRILGLLTVSDLSMVEVTPLSATQRTYSVHLVTYAHGSDVFHKNRNIQAYSAINRGIDFIHLYRKEHIDPQYIQDHPILNEKVGAGYWLWKPYLILKTLEKIPEGDILLYGDSGMLIRQPINNLIESALKDKDIVLFDYFNPVHGTASRSATGDIFAAVDCQTDACYKSPHVWAGIVLLRNSLTSRAFIKQWLSLCETPLLINGGTGKVPNQPNFSHHQHDEGILSALAAKHRDDIHYVPMDENFHRHIKVHRRKKDDVSLLGEAHVNQPKFITRILKDKAIRFYQKNLAALGIV